MARKSLSGVPPVPGKELTFELKEWFNQVFRFYRIIETRTLVIDPPSIAAATTAEQAFSLNEVEVGDSVLSVTKPTNTAGLGIVGARISGSNTISITFMNCTGAAIDAPSETYTIDILKFRGN